MKLPLQTLLHPALVMLTAVLALNGLGCSQPKNVDKKQSEQESAAQWIEKAVAQVPGKYDQLDQFLDPEEQLAANAVHAKHQSILSDWHKEHGEKIRKGRAALSDFLKTKDKKKAKKAIKRAKQDDVKKLVLQERQLQKDYESELKAAIPPETLAKWQADKIARTLLKFLEPIALTKTQIAKIRELAPLAIQKVPKKDEEAWHMYGTSELEILVERKVLEASQKKPFEDLKNSNRLRKLSWSL